MTGFDWEALKRRTGGAVERTLDEAELAAVFRERARTLAKRPESDAASASGREHLFFKIGNVRFAVPLQDVRSIVALAWVTQIPGAPEFKCRVTHLGGKIVSLIDLASLMRLGDAERTPLVNRCLLLEHAGSCLGVLVHDLIGIELVDESALSAPGQTTEVEFVRGITRELVLVLDGKKMVSSLRAEGPTKSSK